MEENVAPAVKRRRSPEGQYRVESHEMAACARCGREVTVESMALYMDGGACVRCQIELAELVDAERQAEEATALMYRKYARPRRGVRW